MTISIISKTDTFIKETPIDSSKLDATKKQSVAKGSELIVSSIYTWGNHYRVSINGNVKYLFSGHWQVNLPVVLPYFEPTLRVESIIMACEAMGVTNKASQAYVLATVQHETDNTYLPIEEYYGELQAVKLRYEGGKRYFGRGLVQITGSSNYAKFGKLLAIDLANQPELALQPSIALFILVVGMRDGLFAGKKLGNYFSDKVRDFKGARAIVNGRDRADKIASLALAHLKTLDGGTREYSVKPITQSDSYIGMEVSKFTLISQRDNNADRNKDGKNDAYQTCNIHSVKMVIGALTDYKPSIAELDNKVIVKPGSRYSHNNLVWLMGEYGVKSQFSTTTTVAKLLAHLEKGLPAIWSNKLTHGGHIVVIAGYDKTKSKFLILDSYGEPTKVLGKWAYKDVRKPYWLSLKSFNSVSMNGASAASHWLHLCSK